jgi:hypothetical protein
VLILPNASGPISNAKAIERSKGSSSAAAWGLSKIASNGAEYCSAMRSRRDRICGLPTSA